NSNPNSRHEVVVLVPTDLLHSGDCQILLAGKTVDGKYEPAATYSSPNHPITATTSVARCPVSLGAVSPWYPSNFSVRAFARTQYLSSFLIIREILFELSPYIG